MALKAKRYENDRFPRFNLGRVCEAQGPAGALSTTRVALKENAVTRRCGQGHPAIEARRDFPSVPGRMAPRTARSFRGIPELPVPPEDLELDGSAHGLGLEGVQASYRGRAGLAVHPTG